MSAPQEKQSVEEVINSSAGHPHGTHHRNFSEIIEDVSHTNATAFQRFAGEDDGEKKMMSEMVSPPSYSSDEQLGLHPETNQYKIPLEEFLYFSEGQRALEKREDYGSGATAIGGYFSTKILRRKKESTPDVVVETESPFEGTPSEEEIGQDTAHSLNPNPSLQARLNANRALRNASWMSVFYLITTDILGPTSAPWAVSQLGYVPGALLFVLLGVAAVYCGILLWKMFLKLDSAHYPLKNYGDLVGRIYGEKIKYGVDCLQIIQLLCNVAVIILGNGQGLYQVAQEKVCFAVMVLVWALAGMIVGQIKSLQRFGFLANIAIWMNMFVVFATMGVTANMSPNYKDADPKYKPGYTPDPIVTKAIISGSGNFSNQLSATMNIVYSYGGAMVYIEFLSEMRRPMDFWKGMFLAEGIIFACYMVFGLVVYNFQGQYTMNPANQGIPAMTHVGYAWQTTTNVVSLVSALIAAGLYGNVGIKVLYTALIQKLTKGPELQTRAGRFVWIILVICYWAVAYVIASAIPQFSSLTSLVGAICILQFTYTFPPIMQVGLDVQLSAMKADGPYDPVNKTLNRVDNFNNWSRWYRGYMDKFFLNTAHVLLFLASLATAALGIYASAMNLKADFNQPGANSPSFSCKPDF